VVSLAVLSACGKSAPSPVATTPVVHAPTMVPATSQERSGTLSALPPTIAPTAPTAPAQLQAQASAEVASVASGLPAGSVSVAALNTTTGATFSAGATSGMWTASAYKLFVLETLLLREQSSGGLSSSQLASATRMIENSDNVAGYSLFEAAGGNSSLAAAAKQFGMTNTVPGRTDPTFTTTSASDYLHLLQNLVAPGPLNPSSQALALGLMTHVEADQRWGVGVVADPGTTFANKNGWLSVDNTNGVGEQDNGLWVVSSVGVVTVHGQQVLMCIFTRHRPSMQNGVTLVQTLAQDVAPAVAP
jgi:beta-lactamase class A